jgi:hypothetical protein
VQPGTVAGAHLSAPETPVQMHLCHPHGMSVAARSPLPAPWSSRPPNGWARTPPRPFFCCVASSTGWTPSPPNPHPPDHLNGASRRRFPLSLAPPPFCSTSVHTTSSPPRLVSHLLLATGARRLTGIVRKHRRHVCLSGELHPLLVSLQVKTFAHPLFCFPLP